MRLQSAVVCGHCERRIEGGATSPSHQCHNPLNTRLHRNRRLALRKTASPECAVHVLYEKMASPERDEPRSLRMMAAPERDEPRSLRMMAAPERDEQIDKDLTVSIDKILRKRGSG